MTWIILTGLTCATVILFANHSMAVARLNRLEQTLHELNREEPWT